MEVSALGGPIKLFGQGVAHSITCITCGSGGVSTQAHALKRGGAVFDLHAGQTHKVYTPGHQSLYYYTANSFTDNINEDCGYWSGRKWAIVSAQCACAHYNAHMHIEH